MHFLREAFSEFLSHVSDAIDQPNCLTIQGRHKWSLSLQLQLSSRQYSAILIGCGLVNEYGDTVRVNKDGWDDFLHNYTLR
eukprot:14922689-Alexandrium_andersonii.AAC.1